ncbi:peritrophin-1-like [Physella acuta]|uniref:peritrophin-1-like n=1 Tax=Physella acuta TaxID=109671 RepID=UPI0027DD05E5|nr:peritrophin-1-like [Physella acuta]
MADNMFFCLLMLGGVTLSLQQTVDVTNVCSHNRWPDGLYAHPYHCSKFIECVSYQTTVMDCPGTLLFSGLNQTCMHMDVAECFHAPPPTEPPIDLFDFCARMNLTNGIYPNPTDCSKYIMCTFMTTAILSCPAGQSFYHVFNNCVYFATHSCL